MYHLRGHHLLCLLGFRGMGYSAEYVKNMSHIYHTLQKSPHTFIQMVHGPDDLCAKFPHSNQIIYHCEDDNIYHRDEVILSKLQLEEKQIIPWMDICHAIQNFIVPSDIETICHTCSWRSYGVCAEGIKDLQAGLGLRKINT